MGIIVHEDHVICVPPEVVPAASEHMMRPKEKLAPLPHVVLTQVTGIALRISQLVRDLSGDEQMGLKALMLEEAIINAVSHGNAAVVTKQVRVEIRAILEGETVHFSVRVQDEGAQKFDVNAEIEEALDVENFERPDGRGLLYMRDIAHFDVAGPVYLPDDAGKHLTFTRQFPINSLHALAACPEVEA